MHRSTFITLIAFTAVLVGLNVYQFMDRMALRDQIASQRLEPGAGEIRSGRSAGPSARGTVTGSGPSAASRAKSERSPGGPAAAANDAAKREGFSEIAEQWAQLMDNPAMKKQLLAQMDAQVGPALADLFAYLELEGEELTHFKGLIAEQWMAQQQVGMKMMSAMGDSERHAAIKEDLKETRESTEAKIREFLNDEEDFAYFQRYQQQLPDRMELEQFTSALEAKGLELKEGQKEELLSAMGEERVASELGDVSDPEGWDFDNFDEQTVAEVMGKMSDFHRRVQVRAGTVLDEQQMQVLSTSQEQQRNMQEMGMKMGLEMMKSMRKEE